MRSARSICSPTAAIRRRCPLHHATQTVPLAPPQAGFGQCFLTKLSPDGSTAFYTVIFEGAQCQAMALGPEDRSDTRKMHLQVGTSFHYQRTLTESATNGLTLEPLQGAYDVCVTDQGSCGPVQWMRADANGDVYFIMSYSPVGMTPPDFVYELRKIDTQGQLVGAIRLIQPPIYAQPGGNFVHDQITGLELDNRGYAYADRLRRVAGHHHADRERADVVQAVGQRLPRSDVRHLLRRVRPEDRHHRRRTFAVAYASYLGGTRDDRPFGVAWDPSSSNSVRHRRDDLGEFSVHARVIFSGRAAVRPEAGFSSSWISTRSRRSSFGSARSSPARRRLDVAVLPGGMTAVVGQATDFEPAGLSNCFRLVGSLYPPRFQIEQRPFLSVFSADGAAMPFSSFLDATAGSNSFVTNVAANGSPIVYAAMTTEDGALGTPGALQPSNRRRRRRACAGDRSGRPRRRERSAVDRLHAGGGERRRDRSGRRHRGAVDLRPAVRVHLDEPDGELLTHLVWFGPNGFRAANPGVLPAAADPAWCRAPTRRCRRARTPSP